MGVFRRPELEKDNPVAPQMYVGPRRRNRLALAASKESASPGGNMAATLQILAGAAERFVVSMPVSKKREEKRTALLKAIAQAHRLLSDSVSDEAECADEYRRRKRDDK